METSGLEVAGIPSVRCIWRLVVPNSHFWHPGLCSLLGGLQKRPLSSEQAPGSCLSPGFPPAPATSWVCGPDVPYTHSTHTLVLGAPARDYSPHPLPAWWPAPVGSTQCLTPASARAPDWGLWGTVQLLGLLQTLILGPGRWPIDVIQLDYV